MNGLLIDSRELKYEQLTRNFLLNIGHTVSKALFHVECTCASVFLIHQVKLVWVLHNSLQHLLQYIARVGKTIVYSVDILQEGATSGIQGVV